MFLKFATEIPIYPASTAGKQLFWQIPRKGTNNASDQALGGARMPASASYRISDPGMTRVVLLTCVVWCDLIHLHQLMKSLLQIHLG